MPNQDQKVSDISDPALCGDSPNDSNNRHFIIRPNRLGRGLFATRLIENGEAVLHFRGPIIDYERSCDPHFERFCVQIGPNSYTRTWAPERFINHSCDPNCGFQDARTLRAIRIIQPDEEITFDYSTSMAEDSWTMECACLTSKCRGTIKDFVDLPPEVKSRYRKLGIVPAWLSEQFERQQIEMRGRGLRPYQIPSNGNGNGNGNGSKKHS